MKTKFIALFFLSLFFSLSSYAQSPDEKIGSLLNNVDYFELNRQYPLLKDSVHPMLNYLAKAVLEDAFNKREDACETIMYLYENLQQELGGENITRMLAMRGQNLMNLGRYEEAADMLGSLSSQSDLGSYVSEQTILFLNDLNKRAQFLKAFPKSEIVRPDRDCAMPIIKDTANHIRTIEVEINGKKAPFIFDTGADVPAFVSMEFAKENGIQIIGDSIMTGGITHTDYTKLGFTDSLKIGDIIYKNVWFIVSPKSEIMYNDSVIGRVDAVLGRLFFDMLVEFHIYPKENKIVFPIIESEMPKNGNNMLIFNGQPFIEGVSNGERLLLHFDTGGGIALQAKYYRKHKDVIETTCSKDSIGVGGFGGAKRLEIYKLPTLPLMIDNVNCDLSDVGVFMEDFHTAGAADGTIGMDFIEMFDKAIFNFKKMFFKLEK